MSVIIFIINCIHYLELYYHASYTSYKIDQCVRSVCKKSSRLPLYLFMCDVYKPSWMKFYDL
nr:hypothetical protein B11C_110529 [Bartonella sp. 1-1C]